MSSPSLASYLGLCRVWDRPTQFSRSFGYFYDREVCQNSANILFLYAILFLICSSRLRKPQGSDQGSLIWWTLQEAIIYKDVCFIQVTEQEIGLVVIIGQQITNKINKMSRTFKVRYNLQYLQTRNSPLFPHIKAYLLSEGAKRVISQTKQFTKNRVNFQTNIEEDHKILVIQNNSSTFSQSKIIIIFEFQAEGRYIKMGETVIDLAEIVNSNRQGQLLSYKVDKCYDRNAKIWLSVEMRIVDNLKLNKITQNRSKEDMHSRSFCDLQFKQRGRQIYDTSYNNQTQISILENEAFKEDFSLLSDNPTSYNPRINLEKLTTGKTQVHRKAYQRNEEISQLQEELAAAATELRMTKQELAAVEGKYVQVAEREASMEQKLKLALSQNLKMTERCEQLGKQVINCEKSWQGQKEQLSGQVQKYIKMYQQSQNMRNKLLVDIDSSRDEQKEKMKEIERRAAEAQNKSKNAIRNENSLKKDLQSCISEMAFLDKTYKAELAQRSTVQAHLSEAVSQIQSVNRQKEWLKNEISDLKNKNEEINQQLQMSKFTIGQLSKQLLELKKTMQGKNELICRYQAELELSNQAIMTERGRFGKQLQEIEMQAEVEHKNIQKYIEDLQTKTINQYSKTNELSQLRKQISKLRRSLTEQREKAQTFENQLMVLKEEKKMLQARIVKGQEKTLQLVKQKQILQTQLKKVKDDLEQKPLQNWEGLTEEQRQELTVMCYEQRDEYWRLELEKIERDTKILLENHRNEKDQFSNKIQLRQIQIQSKKDEINQITQKNKRLQQAIEKLRKQNKEAEVKISNIELKSHDLEVDISNKQSKIQTLLSKTETFQQLETSLAELQKKMSSKNKELAALRGDLQKQKNTKAKTRIQTKQIISTVSNLITKSQKHKMFYDQLRCQHIDSETLSLFNSSLRVFCDKHNKVRQKLERLEQKQSDLQQSLREDRLNSSNKIQRKLSNSSRSSKIQLFIDEEQPFLTNKSFNTPQYNFHAALQKRQEKETIVALLRQQNQQAKTRLDKQKAKNVQLQREIQRLHKNIEQNHTDYLRLSEQSDKRSEDLQVLAQKLRSKQKQYDSAWQEIRNLSGQLSQAKNQLQQVNKMLKLEKSQAISKKSQFIKANPVTINDDSYFKTMQLQKKLKASQQEVDKLRRQKQERRKEQGPFGKQIKQVQLKLKQKEVIITNLRKQIEEQRENNEQQREMQQLRLKKIKQAHQQEQQVQAKQIRQLKQKLAGQEERVKLLHKKIKNLEDSLKSSSIQMAGVVEKEDKTKKLINSEWELRVKSLQTQHNNEIAILKRQIEQQRGQDKTLREIIQKKEKEISDQKEEVEKKLKEIQGLVEQCEVYGVRIKNYEEEEGAYKQTIEVLEKKMLQSREGSRRNVQNESSQKKSSYSIKAYTFR